MTPRSAATRSLQSLVFSLISLIFVLILSGCGGNRSPSGITANVLILVTDPQGNPVPGATVWIEADAAAEVSEDTEAAAFLTDPQGNSCDDPPGLALFAACTDSGGIAVLPCGGDGFYLVQYFQGTQSGATNAQCAQAGVVPAPLGP